MPQVQQEVGLGSSIQVQAALGQILRKRLVVQREERDRVRETVRLQSLLQGGDAPAHIGAASPAARVALSLRSTPSNQMTRHPLARRARAQFRYTQRWPPPCG